MYGKQNNNWESLKSDTLGGFLPLETGNENYPAHCQMKLKYTNPFVWQYPFPELNRIYWCIARI